mgnify:CR=1 FL=1
MPYEKTHDLLELAIWMQANREGVSLNEIAMHFNVSRRTAERMRNMILAQFPQTEEILEGNQKKWRIPQRTLRDFIQFSADELTAIETAMNICKQNNLDDKLNTLNNVYNKIKACIKTDTLRKIEPDIDALMEAEGFVLRPGPKLNINTDILNQLKEAILCCKKIEITYQTPTKKNSTQLVEPYGFLYGNKHYLVAFSDYAQAYRYYPLHRINNVTILNNYFIRDKNFSLQKYTYQSFGVFQEEPFEVEWLFDASVAADAEQYIFHPTQKLIHNKDGSLTVKFKAGGRLEMDWHLYTWGNKVKVIKPTNWYKE